MNTDYGYGSSVGELTRLLIEKGAEINVKDSNGNTALMQAAAQCKN